MENSRKPSLWLLLSVLTAVAVVATIWSASALAGGGSSPSIDPTTRSGPAIDVQARDPSTVPGDDCPNGSGSAGGDSGSSDSSATDL